MTKVILYFLLLSCLPVLLMAQPGQISIPRIDMMPNAPSPYNMRDWQDVAVNYDEFVYDINKSGQYLPFLKFIQGGVNYPSAQKFSLPSYVGSSSGNEAINVLPSLVGASLVGIDKTNQSGKNFVEMSFDFFNTANGENIYLNNAGASSGNDWWYDIMPNVYFYQLYDLYPNLGNEATYQFNTIANTFTTAIRSMGGKDTPWTKAFMNYRAWNFKTNTPNTTSVPEPESAGSMAWVLYNAYQITHNKEYLKASEWAMEFLNDWPNNPSYELQLSYGVYTAARMNAELGTGYDIDKMVNWCFNKGNLRGWGTIKGTWGGIDVHGLVGEANDNGNDYAFQMNGLHQAAMLAPMTRYDKRYAKAIGKWILHLANANRLFYHGFLPSDRQDATAWSSANDPDKVIGYEALREVWQGKSPFSTGDALKGGWAPTNLALYGTSSIGYLGSIIETTNVEKILKIDLLKTDFYKKEAYPSYLFYNPLATEAAVSFYIGSESADLYESLNAKFILKNVNGEVMINIPAGEAVSIVVCPVDGQITYDKNKMKINGVVVDFDQKDVNYTYAPRIKSLSSDTQPIQKDKTAKLYCTAYDLDSPTLTYQWSTANGTIMGNDATVDYTAPSTPTTSEIQCIVKDAEGNSDTATILLDIVAKINHPPAIINIERSNGYAAVNEPILLKCNAFDEDDDALNYAWSANGGTFQGTGAEVSWSASLDGVYSINVVVTDTEGTSSSASTSVLVKSFFDENFKAIAYYPFSGNALDVSGNNLNGEVKGVITTTDKDGNINSAYYFNGGAQHVIVPNNQKLNFTESASVCAWVKPISLPDKETFVVSHGSWQNRYKISITPDRHLRWTINTLQGTADLDAATELNNDEFTHVCATYDQDIMALYVNGALSSFKKQSGSLRTTTLALLIGQMLPDIALYNFKGTIDEVAIYDKAITPQKVKSIYSIGVTSVKNIAATDQTTLLISPNPTTGYCQVRTNYIAQKIDEFVLIDMNGKEYSIYHEEKDRGHYELDLSNMHSGIYLLKAQSNDGVFTSKLIKI